jgi:hypothetical protein
MNGPVMSAAALTRRGALALLAANLAACGGGGGTTGDPVAAKPVAQPLGNLQPPGLPAPMPPTLVPRRLERLDQTDTGQRRILTLGATSDGGLVVLWLGREPADERASWALWLQRFQANGQRDGDAFEVTYAPDVPDPGNVAAVVMPGGEFMLAWVTDRRQPADEGDAWASTLTLRNYANVGSPIGDELVLDSTLHDPNVPTGKVLGAPVIARWDDGRLLVGWRAHLSDLPAFESDSLRILELSPTGTPLRPMDRLWDFPAPLLELATLERGGWIARTLGGSFTEGSVHARLVQVDLSPPLGLPLPGQLPALSFVLPLRAGAGCVLFGGRHGATNGSLVEPHAQHFSEDGQEDGPAAALPAFPAHALALEGGDYLAFWPQGTGRPMLARRFAPDGSPRGEPFDTGAPDARASTRLPGGGMALAWVAPAAGGGHDVMLQRWDEEPAFP